MDHLYQDIESAEKRIRQYLSPTPLIFSEFLTKAVNATLSAEKKPIKVYLKLESENLTGSFKVRGAYNKLEVNRTNKGMIYDLSLKIMQFDFKIPNNFVILTC